jgi:hypothetical protein
MDGGEANHINSKRTGNHIIHSVFGSFYTIYSAIMNRRIITSALIILLSSTASAWLSPSAGLLTSRSSLNLAGNNHGEGACFLPLEQMESDYYAPRIVQVSVR